MTTTTELVIIICVVVPSAAGVGLAVRSRDSVRRAYAVGWYVAFGAIGVAITLVGVLAHTVYLLTGGLVVTAMALTSYLTRPKGEVG
jgi:hypothetical protein